MFLPTNYLWTKCVGQKRRMAGRLHWPIKGCSDRAGVVMQRIWPFSDHDRVTNHPCLGFAM